MDALAKHYLLKPGSAEEPTQYLGATISKYWINGDPKHKWAIGSQEYVTEAIRVVKGWIKKKNMILQTKVSLVIPSGYKPELDGSPKVDAKGVIYMQLILTILRWIVKGFNVVGIQCNAKGRLLGGGLAHLCLSFLPRAVKNCHG